MISVVQNAMLTKLPYTALRDAIFTHPTMAEGVDRIVLRGLRGPTIAK